MFRYLNIIIFIGILFSLFTISKNVFACISSSQDVTVIFRPETKIDIDKLKKFCVYPEDEKAPSDPNKITYKSHYDDRITIIVERIEGIEEVFYEGIERLIEIRFSQKLKNFKSNTEFYMVTFTQFLGTNLSKEYWQDILSRELNLLIKNGLISSFYDQDVASIVKIDIISGSVIYYLKKGCEAKNFDPSDPSFAKHPWRKIIADKDGWVWASQNSHFTLEDNGCLDVVALLEGSCGSGSSVTQSIATLNLPIR